MENNQGSSFSGLFGSFAVPITPDSVSVPTPVITPSSTFMLDPVPAIPAVDDEDDDSNTQTQPDQEYTESVSRAPGMTPLVSPFDFSNLPRSSSVFVDTHIDEEDRRDFETPHKVARMDDECHPISRVRREMVRSASQLPIPGGLFSLAPRSFSDLTTSIVFIEDLALPVVPGIRGSDKNIRITVQTAKRLMDGDLKIPAGYKLLILDARSAYEFDGGHLNNAINITVPAIRPQIDNLVRKARANDEKYIILCYCQFSSKRAPFLRDVIFAAEEDLMMKERSGAELSTTEKSRFNVLIIKGGYDKFYETFPDAVYPRGYVRETDFPSKRAAYRKVYNKEENYASSSFTLASSLDLKRRPCRSENHDSNMSGNSYLSDDEDSVDSSLARDLHGTRLTFD